MMYGLAMAIMFFLQLLFLKHTHFCKIRAEHSNLKRFCIDEKQY